MKIQLTKILNVKIQKAGKLTIERTVFRSNKDKYTAVIRMTVNQNRQN